MKVLLPLLGLLVFMTSVSHAAEPPPLQAVMKRYDQTRLNQDEGLREKYILELAALRWKLSSHDQDGWQKVDAEIRRHPVIAGTAGFSKARLGKWISPRHDYLYRANETWTLTDGGDDPDNTHGTWSIKGTLYSDVATGEETPRHYTVLLLDAENFIYADDQTVFYEQRPGGTGLPLRRDGSRD
jgi:hypothetical protein